MLESLKNKLPEAEAHLAILNTEGRTLFGAEAASHQATTDTQTMRIVEEKKAREATKNGKSFERSTPKSITQLLENTRYSFRQ